VEGGRLRLLIVDDDSRFVAALTAVVEADGRAEVVGTAENGQMALAEAMWLQPDVVSMDIDMPVMDGVDATRLIVAYVRVPVVLVTGSRSSARVQEALEAGASAHVLKERAAEELVDTLLAVRSKQPPEPSGAG
jgi:DNA-binding NarL/FixJ family response regulator